MKYRLLGIQSHQTMHRYQHKSILSFRFYLELGLLQVSIPPFIIDINPYLLNHIDPFHHRSLIVVVEASFRIVLN